MHDDMQPSRVYDMVKCLKDLQIPCRWVPDMGYRYGYPQFNYYGPTPYYFMSGLNLFGLDLFTSIKLGFIAPLILGNLFIFYLGTSFFGVSGGFIATLLYAYSPYRISDVYSRGAMGETWAYVFLPLIVLALKKISEKSDLKSSALLALSFAGLLTTHNVTTLTFTPLILFYVAYLVFSKAKLDFKNILLEAKSYFIPFVWGGAIAAFFFLPVIFEKQFAHTESMIGGYFDYRAHFVSIKQLFLSTFWGYGSSEMGPADDLSFFFSPVMLFTIFTSTILLVRNGILRKINRLEVSVAIFSVLGLFATFMVHEKSSFIWSLFGPLIYLQFPWRYLVVANFFFSLVGAYTFSGLSFNRIKWKLFIFYVITFLFSVSLFRPSQWYDLTSTEKLSGYSWDKQMTISIFDYLPTSAKTPPVYASPIQPKSSSMLSTIEYLQKGSNWLSFNYSSKENSEITLNILDFPGWKVFVDGKLTEHYHNPDGIIVVKLSEGDHQIFAKLTDTPVRWFGNLLTLITLPLALFVLFFNKKNVSKP